VERRWRAGGWFVVGIEDWAVMLEGMLIEVGRLMFAGEGDDLRVADELSYGRLMS